MKIYTKVGDDGTTGLLFGGRVRKDSPRTEANGAIDEAQAAIGVARAHTETGGELDQILVGLERDLYALMAEVGTAPENRHKLTAGSSLVTPAMVDALEDLIDRTSDRFEMPTEFVLPGEDRVAAFLDVARTVVRRAERAATRLAADEHPAADEHSATEGRDGRAGSMESSSVVPYLNRLSDLLWALARWQEGSSRPSRATGASGR